MTASELSNAVRPIFDNWYNNLKKHQETGSLSSPNTIYCQDQLNVYETEEYFALELTGGIELSQFKTISFSKKVKKLSNINHLINGGTSIGKTAIYNPQVRIMSEAEVWPNLYVASHDGYDSREKCLRPAKLQQGLQGAASIPVEIQGEVGGLFVANAAVLRLEAPRLFFQPISMLLVLNKATDPIRLVHFLIARLNETFPKRDQFIGIYDDETYLNPVLQLQKDKTASSADFLQAQGHLLAQVLGYKTAKTNIALTGSPQGTVDCFLEKENGQYDLLQLDAGFFSRQASQGKKNKPNLSNYALALKAQLQYCQQHATALQEQGITLSEQPLIIGLVENINQVYHQALNKTAQEQAGDLLLMTIDTLAELVDLWLKNKA